LVFNFVEGFAVRWFWLFRSLNSAFFLFLSCFAAYYLAFCCFSVVFCLIFSVFGGFAVFSILIYKTEDKKALQAEAVKTGTTQNPHKKKQTFSSFAIAN
jgi:hypothetical protein